MNSIYSKLLFLVLSLLVVSSAATMLAVMTATNNNVERQAATRLMVGGSVFESLMETRGDQLLESARVLTADFGFKQSVALKDMSTIASVLENHGGRINADIVTLFSLDGEPLASAADVETNAQTQFFQEWLSELHGESNPQMIANLGGSAYQLVVVEVRAPTPIAWAMIGFEIDIHFAESLKDMTLLDLSFTKVEAGEHKIIVSTLPSTAQRSLPGVGVGQSEVEDFAHLPIANGDVSGLSIMLSIPLVEERARFEVLQQHILAISAAVLFISLLILIPMLRGVTRPIQLLVLGAQRISGGDYGSPIDTSLRGGAEIEQLAQSFNNMQTAIAAREAHIIHQAHHDTLTGLPLRDKIAMDLGGKINAAVDGGHIAIVSISVQRVKSINNSLGFAIGDKLLNACAERWRERFSAPHVVGRSTASEFFLLYEVPAGESGLLLTERLHGLWSEPFVIEGFEINVPLTLGVATFPEHGTTPEALLRRSDIALNKALELRHPTEFYEKGEDEKHLKQIRLINDLKQAVQENQLTLHYQPKVNVKAGAVTEAEALVRWMHPELGFVPPDEFIGLAEQSGLMPSLSRWILRRGIDDACLWRAQGVDVAVAINLSAYDLVHDDLPSFVGSLLEQRSFPGSALILEVTESAMMEDPVIALKVLNEFKELGVRLAIDDYGTGYSSLGQMKQLPVDELKIDMCFVRNLGEELSDQVIVKSTIAMAHNIGLKVVAEGVEDEKAQSMLEAWGCDKLQGFFFSKPLPLDQFLKWMEKFEYQPGDFQGGGDEVKQSGSDGISANDDADDGQRRAS